MKLKTKNKDTSFPFQEAAFFDHYSKVINLNDIDVYNALNIYSREGKFIVDNLPENLKGKLVLDVGCGVGDISVFFALRGAKVIGIDISPEIIKLAKKLARNHGVLRSIRFEIGDVQNLKYKKDSFDIVSGFAVLHHVDIDRSLREVKRVLKKGGVAFFSDPLNYNPFVKIYDLLERTKQHSPDERRLTRKDIEIVYKNFKKMKWIGTDLMSLPLFGLDFLYLKLIKKNIPINWYQRVYFGKVFSRSYKFFNFLDSILPKFIQLLGWRVVIVCIKK